MPVLPNKTNKREQIKQMLVLIRKQADNVNVNVNENDTVLFFPPCFVEQNEQKGTKRTDKDTDKDKDKDTDTDTDTDTVTGEGTDITLTRGHACA